MCAVSAMLDYGRLKVNTNEWTTITWKEYKELLEKARQWDVLANQPHCEDPAKEQWMQEVEERLKKLEGGPTKCKCDTLLEPSTPLPVDNGTYTIGCNNYTPLDAYAGIYQCSCGGSIDSHIKEIQ